MAVYLRPSGIDDALSHLSTNSYAVVAGCTDHYCRADRLSEDPILDLSGVRDARGIAEGDGGDFRIGALTTWSEIARAELPPQFDALREAARQIGGVQIQNSGTIGGNLCNASPAADGVPPLIALDARVELRSATGARTLRLSDFIIGNRRTTRRADEILTAIIIPKRHGRHASRFLKLGARAYQVISIAMVAVLLETNEDQRVEAAAIAVGACSEVARRLRELEHALSGLPIEGGRLSEFVRAEHFACLRPVSDVRGTAAYRLDAARTLVGRALDDVQDRLR